MQILHPFDGSLEDYVAGKGELLDWHPPSCPMCESKRAPKRHGSYTRTAIKLGWEGDLRIRRYLCLDCKRTLSLLPEFLLPYVRSAIEVVALFLRARLEARHTLKASGLAAQQAEMPYQRGQHWVRRFTSQAEKLAAALGAIATPVEAPSFVLRVIAMLNQSGWIAAHRFLFRQVRAHLLGWPRWLAPDGRGAALRRRFPDGATPAQSICMEGGSPPA